MSPPQSRPGQWWSVYPCTARTTPVAALPRLAHPVFKPPQSLPAVPWPRSSARRGAAMDEASGDLDTGQSPRPEDALLAPIQLTGALWGARLVQALERLAALYESAGINDGDFEAERLRLSKYPRSASPG